MRIDVPQALRAIRIPTLVVQPLVENAIKHGVAPSKSGGDVEVSASIANESVLRIAVRNSGAPLHAAGPRPSGERVGVDNVRRRLIGHYGDTATLTLVTDDAGSTVAEISMPLLNHAAQPEDRDAQAVAGRLS